MIVAVSTSPNRQNRSTCSRMSVPLVQTPAKAPILLPMAGWEQTRLFGDFGSMSALAYFADLCLLIATSALGLQQHRPRIALSSLPPQSDYLPDPANFALRTNLKSSPE